MSLLRSPEGVIMAEPYAVLRFIGDYRFLSNFYASPITLDGVIYLTVEHYFQSQKTNVKSEKERIINAAYARQAKMWGRSVTLRDDWDDVKLGAMRLGVYLKFHQSRVLKKKLVSTGNSILIEGNDWHDNFWGICFCNTCHDNTPGQNHLGKILMSLRESLWSS